MANKVSQLEKDRQSGKTQVEVQRISILEAAEKTFLEKSLEHTSMKDIAAAAEITRASLYRYFPDIATIAFEIAVKMLKKITDATNSEESTFSLETIRTSVVRMIDQFYPLRPAYRYIGMFDHLYGDNYPDEKLAAWYKEQLFALDWIGISSIEISSGIDPEQIAMIGNCTLSFLEKMAARGELLSVEQEVSLDSGLTFYKDMINVYFENIATTVHE